MDCTDARLAISAELDGELDDTSAPEMADHLLSCDDCRRWQEQAADITRRARTSTALPPPAPVVGLLAALSTQPRRRQRARRAALVGVAAAQAACSVPLFFSGDDSVRDFGCVGLAIAVGLAAAAHRPRRASGARVVIGSVAGLLVLTGAISIIGGTSSLRAESVHLVAIVGWLLLLGVDDGTPHTTRGVPRLPRFGPARGRLESGVEPHAVVGHRPHHGVTTSAEASVAA